MKRYRSHKVVEAAKIRQIVRHEDGSADLYCDDDVIRTMDEEWSYKLPELPSGVSTATSSCGYYVVYADGYSSWSPTKAFEEGYTELEA